MGCGETAEVSLLSRLLYKFLHIIIIITYYDVIGLNIINITYYDRDIYGKEQSKCTCE